MYHHPIAKLGYFVLLCGRVGRSATHPYAGPYWRMSVTPDDFTVLVLGALPGKGMGGLLPCRLAGSELVRRQWLGLPPLVMVLEAHKRETLD